MDGPANQLLFETICLEKLVNIVKKYPIKRSRIIGSSKLISKEFFIHFVNKIVLLILESSKGLNLFLEEILKLLF